MLFLLLVGCVVADSGDLATVIKTEGDRIVSSIGDLGERCSHSERSGEILSAVHTSLDLQVRLE